MSAIEAPRLERDKFCPACNTRMAFAKLVAAVLGPGGLSTTAGSGK